jgi:hypothetical protein
MKARRVARLKLPRRVPRLRTLFAVCVDNSEYPASLERWKIYRVLPDRDAERHGQLRVVDESGEDYLFSAAYFQLVELPSPLRRLYRATAA